MMKLYSPAHTLAEIFRSHFHDYTRRYGPLPKHYYAAANAIMRCRTEELGGHIYKCDACSHEVTLYNSCGNRHCPQCRATARAQWVQKRMEDVLAVPYFHVVFTIPHQLNGIALRNKRAFYNLMFQAVSQTLLSLARDPRLLGGEIGFIATLHTWGQTLMDHPHIHCIVPGGAFCEKGNRWKSCKNDFLLPLAPMQKLFRGKCMDYLLKAVKEGTINPMFEATADIPGFAALVKKLYSLKWVVYVKEPFTSPQNLLKYLCRYTHRVAIANHRILNVHNGVVTFSYKDYADGNKRKEMSLDALEFIRRFMLHILPRGFMRIRQYGFLSNKAKKRLLPLIRRVIEKSISTRAALLFQTDTCRAPNPFLCPQCKKGTLLKLKHMEAINGAVFKRAVNG
jgi:hypothetical protein